MATASTAAELAKFGSLLAVPTRAEILCALMDGRAYTGNELARHVGVAPSTVSEHLSKLLDGGIVAMEAQGRHRYWRLANDETAQLLEALGAALSVPSPPKAPADLAYARTCYNHLAGELAVDLYQQLIKQGHLVDQGGVLNLGRSGLDIFESIGMDVSTISTNRVAARPCLDWTQRQHHLAGAAGTELLKALFANNWIKRGPRPRSIRITETGRTALSSVFQLPQLSCQ